jgi:hypothetical protein
MFFKLVSTYLHIVNKIHNLRENLQKNKTEANFLVHFLLI